jgi:hypothetical protein
MSSRAYNNFFFFRKIASHKAPCSAFIATVGEGSTSTVSTLTAVEGVQVQTPTISRVAFKNHIAPESDAIDPDVLHFLRHLGGLIHSQIAIALIARSGSTGKESYYLIVSASSCAPPSDLA